MLTFHLNIVTLKINIFSIKNYIKNMLCSIFFKQMIPFLLFLIKDNQYFK